MPAPLLLDLSHTSHTRARTGIQRVTRSLWSALGDRALPITYDPHGRNWRKLQAWEIENLGASDAAEKRGTHWPLEAKVRGRTQRWLGRPTSLPDNSGLLVPEVFSSEVARALPEVLAATRGPRVALFHDAIALKLPELTPTKTVARFPPYLVELLTFDGIAAVSEDSRLSLIDYWQWLGVAKHPQVQTIPLGIVPHDSGHGGENSPKSDGVTVLCIGTIEGRKNHVALLDACETLWARGQKFSLQLIGSAHPQTGAPAIKRLRELQTAGRPLRYDGPVSDQRLEAAYAACTFTVYPSLGEGFGLPVIESLAHGKPCICSARGALGESARGGGCVTLETVDAPALTDAIARLLSAPGQVVALATEARNRRFKTWTGYANELVTWMQSLRAHSV
jgi:glycosyltransferase involved in cell wall biosynthesis